MGIAMLIIQRGSLFTKFEHGTSTLAKGKHLICLWEFFHTNPFIANFNKITNSI